MLTLVFCVLGFLPDHVALGFVEAFGVVCATGIGLAVFVMSSFASPAAVVHCAECLASGPSHGDA